MKNKNYIVLAMTTVLLFILSAIPSESHTHSAIEAVLIVIFSLSFVYWVGIWLYGKFFISPAPTDNSNKKVNKKNVILAAVSVVAFICILIISEAFIRQFSLTRQAETDLQASQAAREVLGVPIKFGWVDSFHVELTPGGGAAKLTMHVSGSKKSAKLYVIGTRESGMWHLVNLNLAVRGENSNLEIVPLKTPE